MASYVNQSIPEVPQTRLADRLAVQQQRGEEGGQSRQLQARQKMAEFLSSINLSRNPLGPIASRRSLAPRAAPLMSLLRSTICQNPPGNRMT